jgi:hypothetical protein
MDLWVMKQENACLQSFIAALFAICVSNKTYTYIIVYKSYNGSAAEITKRAKELPFFFSFYLSIHLSGGPQHVFPLLNLKLI